MNTERIETFDRVVTKLDRAKSLVYLLLCVSCDAEALPLLDMLHEMIGETIDQVACLEEAEMNSENRT